MKALAMALVLTACAGAQQASRGAGDGVDTSESIAAEMWEAFLKHDPTSATFVGDRRYDSELPDLSQAAHGRWLAELNEFKRRLQALPKKSEPDLTAQVALVMLDNDLGSDICHRETWDVDQLDGYQVSLAELGSYQIVDSAAASAAYVTRLSGISALFDQHLDNLKRGLADHRTAPRVVVARVIKQLDALLETKDDESPYLGVLDHAKLAAGEVDRLRADIVALVKQGVRPALTRYRDFLRDTYLAASREQVGVGSMPGGDACYAAMIRSHTGSTKSAQEIHQIGMDELKRLHTEMDAIAKRAGHADYKAYAAALRASPAQYLKTREQLVEHNRKLVRAAEAALPRAFGRLPPWSVDVKPIETFREVDSPAAYYYSAADDQSRPAFYYINTYKPETRPLYNMEALAYHEAVPGHHLQISIAQGLHDLPMLRRHSDFTAFVEGWGLYSELVADELKLYSSDATRFGMLNFQAWRATRLVVDTGMHALGWTRERAVGFMTDNVVLPEQEIANEIDRYIIWPGQALAYMLGRMHIQALRKDAEQQLGQRFDVHIFHDRLLENGPLPLEVLQAVMQSWLGTEQTAGGRPATP